MSNATRLLMMICIVKSGVSPDECVSVCRHIIDSCPQLVLNGLMTIGMFGRDPSVENPDFKASSALV